MSAALDRDLTSFALTVIVGAAIIAVMYWRDRRRKPRKHARRNSINSLER